LVRQVFRRALAFALRSPGGPGTLATIAVARTPGRCRRDPGQARVELSAGSLVPDRALGPPAGVGSGGRRLRSGRDVMGETTWTATRPFPVTISPQLLL